MMNADSAFDRTPLYNLSSVLRETSLKADLVRAWENRYGLPKPQRSAGGHRLYSEHDIQTLKWLRSRQAEGLSISRAVELWNQLLGKGQDPLQGIAAQETVQALPSLASGIETLRDEWLAACMRFDGTAAEMILNQAFSLYQVEQVCTLILQSGLRIIGEQWYAGTATAQQEHFASALAIRKLDAILASAPVPVRNETILVGCPAGEWHTIPALLISVFMVRRGYRVVFLGANVPLDQLTETAEAIQPNLIILSAQRLPSAASLKTAASRLHGFLVAFGGLIFNLKPDLIPYIGGHYLGTNLDGIMNAIERILFGQKGNPVPLSPLSEMANSSSLFINNRGFIESEMNAQLQLTGGQPESLAEINLQFGDAIAAALTLGSLDLLTPELVWVDKLIQHRPGIANTLTDYLKLYSQVTQKVLGKSGELITNWLNIHLSFYNSSNTEKV